MKQVIQALISVGIVLGLGAAASADRVTVVRSYAACKDRSIVEQFEDFERRADDQG